MCVSGAAGAADRLREAVFLTQQQHPLSGALQHPSAGKQSDQVRILYSKQKKLHTIIKITIGNQFSDSYMTTGTWFFFLPLFD